MIWTVIYRDSSEKNMLSKVIYGPHGERDTMSHLKDNFDGDVLAIIAGDQAVYFNNPI